MKRRGDPKIVSMIPYNGEWVRQEDLPPEYVKKVVAQVITRAANNIGLDVKIEDKPA